MGQVQCSMDETGSVRQLTWLLCKDMWAVLTSIADKLRLFVVSNQGVIWSENSWPLSRVVTVL